jgi:hypothetical protein
MASLYTSEQIPTTSEQAIRVFDERYLAAISAAQPPGWAEEFGDMIPMGAPRATFPLGLLSTKYLETKEGSSRFKTMQEESFDLKVVEYDAGYEAKLIDLLDARTFAYRKWQQIPARWVIAEKRHVNRNIVTLLEGGIATYTTPWDGLNFFSASHKANPTGDPSTTFSNYQSAAADVTDLSKLSAEITAMQGVLDENGENMGVDPTHVMVPTAKYNPLVLTLAKAMALGSGTATAPESNPLFGKLKVVHCPELTDVNDWYLVDANMIRAMGIPPWVAGKFQPAADLGLRKWDESSDFFKDTGKIKMSSHIWYGFGLVFPHAIRRVVGA